MGNNAGGRLARLDRAGNLTVLADKDPRGGKFHTVDDVAVRSDGTIYFSDGDFSHAQHTSLILTPTPLYILKPGPEPRELVAGPSVAGPNGVELSRDEKTLYLDAYFGGAVHAYAVAPDGSLGMHRTLAGGVTDADSLCVDLSGNLYVGTTGGLQIFGPDGKKIKKVPIARANKVTNCTFGGDDGKTLFITAWTDVWKIENMPIPGLDWTINQAIDCGPPLAPGSPATFATLPPARP
jgi:gluconolactonase